jgi:hypothetical protein
VSDGKSKKVGASTDTIRDFNKGTMIHIGSSETVVGTPVDHARPDLRKKPWSPK